MTAHDFALIGGPLMIVLVAILSLSRKGMDHRDNQIGAVKKAIANTHLRNLRARRGKAEKELAAVRFVPIGVIPVSASRLD